MRAADAMADLVIVRNAEPSTSNPVAAEAQAMARPVIASSIGALPEIVRAPPHVDEDDRTGWLVNPSDPIALARAIAAALALEAPVRQAVGARARRHAEARFSPARPAATTLGGYTALLEGES